MRIRFLCMGNSARSQMAEGLARHLLGLDLVIESAGSKPAGVNPFAVKALRELDIDISSHRSKSIDELSMTGIDWVVTLCAEELCPVLPGNARKLHWSIEDPAGRGTTDEERLAFFRRARDEIRHRIESFVREIDMTSKTIAI